MRRKIGESRGGIVCPLTYIFDAIYSTYYRLAHSNPNSQGNPTDVVEHNGKGSESIYQFVSFVHKRATNYHTVERGTKAYLISAIS
jgi:hypothetical protein